MVKTVRQWLLCVSVLASSFTGAVTIDAPAGKIAGLEKNGMHYFRGIPYARPPVGERRWQAPEPRPRMESVFQADNYGAICPQPSSRAGSADLAQSEDCLSLNIWSPDLTPQKKQPVMVWIHGGSFQFGSSRDPRTEASQLAANGVVVVTLNYRLGLLGRFAHPALSREQTGQPRANYGLMDQVLALKWIQENISRFGGDPDNVTIFGNSAGAVSVNFLLASPASAGLFQHAIAQSSAVLIPRSRHISRQVGAQLALESEGLDVAEQLGITNDDKAVSKLRQLTVEQLLALKIPRNSSNPVVDGVFVVEDLATSFSTGRIHAVDYMAGVVSWEASLIQPMKGMPVPAFLDMIASTYNFTPQQLQSEYEGSTSMQDDIFADSFHASTLYLAQSAARHGLHSYLYWFDYLPNAAEAAPGVAHSGEVPYIFGNLQQRYKEGSPPETELDRQVSDRAQAYWLNFSATGDPNGDGLPKWPALKTGSNTWMIIGAQSRPEKNLLQRRMRFWLENYQKQSEAGR